MPDRVERYGEAGDLPVAGDWSGKGIDSLGIYRQGVFHLRPPRLADADGNPVGAAITVEFGLPGDLPVVGDWDGAGIATIGVYRHAHFAEPITLAQTAIAIGIHPVHLAREFRRNYCSTVGEYVRQLRIESACQRLATSDEPLNQIALALGLFDQSHFSRTFKTFIGMSPANYRQNFRFRTPSTKA